MLNNRYLIRSTLGRGGFGETYLVEDTHSPSHRLRVLKQLKPQTNDPNLYPVIRDRFEREAAILERLGEASDQIPSLHSYFSEGGEFYLVQDWVEGKSLAQKVREEGVFSENEVREFLNNILPVLGFVHSEGIMHRDINPNNVMIRQRDAKPVLIDFGAVKEVVTTVIDAHGLPASTVTIGSPGYMPWEQIAGRPVFASDIYCLGLTTIFSLTSKHPLEMRDQRTVDVSWREHALGVSQDLADVLSKAIEYHPHDRYSSGRQMLEVLQANTRPDSPAERPAQVFNLGEPVGVKRAWEATTQLSEDTVLQREIKVADGSSVQITEPSLLIRINKLYREGISAEALYDVTRGVWRVVPRRERARYAMAVYSGIVREVYAIEEWHPAGTTAYTGQKHEDVVLYEGRWEFTGRLAPEEVRDKYVGRSVAAYFKHGQQNPVVYVNC
jgi:serine/threonine protein kinase